MIEIYATVVGVLQYAFPPIYATVVRSQGIPLFRPQALRKVLYGFRKQRSEILFLFLRHR